MFDELRSAITTLEAVARELDSDCLDGERAAAWADEAGRGERVCAAIKTLAARRVADTKVWQRDGHRSAADWLGRTSGESPAAAQRTLETARNLDGLEATKDAFRSGRISERQASEIASAAGVDPNRERELLDAAANQPMKELRERVRQVRASVEDDRAWARRLHVDRKLERWTDADGAYRLSGRFTPDAGAQIDSAIQGHVTRLWKEAKAKGQRPTWDQLAADALVAAVRQGPCKPIETKLVLDAAAAPRGYTKEGEQCRILGIGTIPVTIAQRLLDDAQVSLLAKDGDELTSLGRARRTIPAALRRELETRYPVCGVPGCGSEARHIDHIIALALGGPTIRENTWRLYVFHHDLKTYFGWKVVGTTFHWDLVSPDDPRPPYRLPGHDPP